MATATTVSMVLALGAPNGPKKVITATASDVTTEYLIFPSGGSELTFSNKDVYIVDFISNSATGDCSLFEIYRGGTTDGTRLLKASHGPTAVSRPTQNAPIRIAGSQSFKVKQLT